ncbi:MAG: hypothetical protein F4X66_20040 [Chloroflexi bacterium]|nr:hypothetical protein [Chloroflexota bacterium]
MLLILVGLFLVLLIPFAVGFTLYSRTERWKLVGKTLMAVPVAMYLLFLLYLSFAGVWPFCCW